MIFIDRRTAAPPASLTTPDGPGATELLAARTYYQTDVAKAYPFRAYKGADVKAALESLFHGKCAYCETFYGAAAPLDVEHYRPKGGVEGEVHPGYWWIAMAWDNLFPSCLDCNRKRNQIVVVEGMTQEEVEKQRLSRRGRIRTGKKDAFPIRGVRCLPENVNFVAEDPLLINPTNSDPERHLIFTTESTFSLVLPVSVEGVLDPVGAASIQVYGLNRVGLVQDRTAFLRELQLKQKRLERCLQNAATSPSPIDMKHWTDEAVTTMRELEATTKSSERYSALGRAFVAKIKANLQREARAPATEVVNGVVR